LVPATTANVLEITGNAAKKQSLRSIPAKDYKKAGIPMTNTVWFASGMEGLWFVEKPGNQSRIRSLFHSL